MEEYFKFEPIVGKDKLIHNINEFIEIQSAIEEQLKEYPNFDGIQFVDVNANGIQIRGFHKQSTYSFIDQLTIKYDFSNYKECIEMFVLKWKERDNNESLDWHNRFIEQGEQYGWD